MVMLLCPHSCSLETTKILDTVKLLILMKNSHSKTSISKVGTEYNQLRILIIIHLFTIYIFYSLVENWYCQ